MYTLNIGPLTVQTSHLLMLAALLITGITAALAARPNKLNIPGVLTDMALGALLAGRIIFILHWWRLYTSSPWSVFDIRDGGFTPWAALMGGLIVAAWRCWRNAALRRPLSLGIIAGLLAWQFSGGPALLAAARQPNLPELSLTALDSGEHLDLGKVARGKPAVVNLWASWCPPCRQEMPLLVAEQGRRQDIAFIFVNQGEGPAEAEMFIGSQPTMRNVMLDPQGSLGRAVGSTALPTTLFYDAKGKLIDMHIGVLSPATLASKLEKMRSSAN